MNLYDELELPKDCTSEEIKQKYRLLAQIYHPDKAVFGDEEKFKRIKLAYETLSDPTKRVEYDSTGRYGINDTTKTEAITRLSNMMVHFTKKLNPECDDLMLSFKVDIHQAQENIKKSIESFELEIKKLKIFSNKIKRKKEGENILKSFVDNMIEQYEREIISMKRTLEIFDLMLNILDDYQYGDLTLLLENQEWSE
jgi:curved DNA-binding protein CbpA